MGPGRRDGGVGSSGWSRGFPAGPRPAGLGRRAAAVSDGPVRAVGAGAHPGLLRALCRRAVQRRRRAPHSPQPPELRGAAEALHPPHFRGYVVLSRPPERRRAGPGAGGARARAMFTACRGRAVLPSVPPGASFPPRTCRLFGGSCHGNGSRRGGRGAVGGRRGRSGAEPARLSDCTRGTGFEQQRGASLSF